MLPFLQYVILVDESVLVQPGEEKALGCLSWDLPVSERILQERWRRLFTRECNDRTMGK